MTIRSSSSSGIPFGDNDGRPANPNTGQPYFNGEAGRLEIYTTNGWNNIVQETPGVSSITGHYYESENSGTITVSGTNFVDGAIAYAVGTNGTEYQATSTTYNSLVQLSVVFEDLSPDYEPYDIKITNPSNLFGLLPDALTLNDTPDWTTAEGTFLTIGAGQAFSSSIVATDDESDTITYSSSNLPEWATLNSSTGGVTGNAPLTIGSYNFTATASDGINTPRSRSFSISVTPASLTGGTLSSDSTYYYRAFTSSTNLVVSNGSLSVDYLMVGGGGAGEDNGGGGGAGGLFYATSQTITPATYTIQVGAGGASGGANGQDTTFNGKTALGGAGSVNGSTAGKSGGSGSGTGRDSNKSGGSATQPGSATGGYGNNGGGGQASTYAGGGGGGGAGGAGGIGSPTGPAGSNGNPGDYYAGSGGVGLTNSLINAMGAATSTGQLSGGNYYYAGGGGGGAFQMVPSNLSTYGLGGLGGGGIGGNGYDNRGGYSGTTYYRAIGSGLANTGGGGGGGFVGGYGGSALGTGGSGIVIVRYTKASVGG